LDSMTYGGFECISHNVSNAIIYNIGGKLLGITAIEKHYGLNSVYFFALPFALWMGYF